MVYVLGFFAANGYITLNKRGANFWNIQITDKKLLYQIKKVIKSEHKIGVKIGKGNNKTLYRLQVGSKEMCDDLRGLGLREGKTKSLAVPNIPQKYFPDFVRGYFDGDGNVWVGYTHKDRLTPLLVIRVVFTSCSRMFLETIKSRLENLNIHSGVLIGGKGNYCRLAYNIHSTLRLYNFMYNQGVIRAGGLFLIQKKRVFEKYIKKCGCGVAV